MSRNAGYRAPWTQFLKNHLNRKQSTAKEAVRYAVGCVAEQLEGRRMLASGQIYVVETSAGRIGEYDATTGAVINANLVSGLDQPYGIVVANGDIWVTNQANGTVGEYTEAGVAVNVALITGLQNPTGIALNGVNLYVTEEGVGSGVVGEFNCTTGQAVNANLVTGLSSPSAICVVGQDLFVTDSQTGNVGEFDANSGTTVTTALITGLAEPQGIASDSTTTTLTGATTAGSNSVTGLSSTALLFVGEQVAPSADIGTGTTIASVVSGTAITLNQAATATNATASLTFSGNYLFVTNHVTGGVIGEYTTTGAVINAALVVPPPFGDAIVPYGVSTYGGDLYFTNTASIPQNTETGGIINSALVGVGGTPTGIDVVQGSAPAPPPSDASIFGVVYGDTNDDGRQEHNELGMGGITVILQPITWRGRANGAATVTATNHKGKYSFIKVPTGSYSITVVPPANFEITQPSTRHHAIGDYTVGLVGGTDLYPDFGLYSPPSLVPAPFGPLTINGAFTFPLTGPFGKSATVNFSGTGTAVTSGTGTTFSFTFNPTGSDTATESSPILRTKKVLGPGLFKVTGPGTATVVADGTTYTFTTETTGTIFMSHKKSTANMTFFAVDANGNRLEQGPQAIFSGTWQD